VPDGRRRNRGGSAILFAIVLVVSIGPVLPADAAFPGENGLIAFVREGERRGIYTIEDFALTRLTSGQDYRPRWSPDGSRIVFQRSFSARHSDIVVMGADGSNVLRLTSRTGFQPAWSSDGSRIVFGSARDGDEDIFVMNADGTEETKLTHNTFDDVLPAWSPDGTKIAFSSRRQGNTDIYLMNADGSGEARFTRNEAGDMNPDWSPDGSLLVFQSNRRQSNWDIYSMHVDGEGLTRLTRSSALEWAPAWSPDGTKITFTLARYRRDVEDIVILDLESSERLRITIPRTYELEPNWQPL
jgi:tol-pal system beta propeller repeat protein TolB